MLRKSKLALALSSALFSTTALAQVVTDGTMGAATTLDGPSYVIDQSLGTINGTNLFHSFTQFDILLDESALFTGSSDISNVISRVTGGNISQIQGSISSEVGNADFYLINPAGVIFSDDARVDVPGAFYVSTAQQLTFSDGGVFSADAGANSTLSIATPESFGFLGTQSGNITFDGADVVIEASNAVGFFASNISLNATRLRQNGGQLSLVAVGDDAVVQQITTPHLSGSGDISFDRGGIKLEGNGDAKLTMVASNINAYKANIVAENKGDIDSQTGIEMMANDVIISNSLVRTETTSSGRAGDLLITADNLTLTSDSDRPQDETVLSSESKERRPPPGSGDEPDGPPPPPPPRAGSQSAQYGDSGDIVLSISNKISVLNNATISNVTQEDGAGGNMLISASELEINSGEYNTDVGIATLTTGTGQGGSLELNIENQVQLIGNGQINAMTLGDGDAGDVVINAGSLRIEETEDALTALELPGINSLSGRDNDFDNAPTGSSGDLTLNIAGELSIHNGGEIVSVTIGNGDAGDININAGSLNLQSDVGGHPITIGSNTLGPSARGDAGNITINAVGAITLQGQAFITTLSDSAGDAGDMTISAQSLFMSGTDDRRSRSGINSSTTGPGSSGNAGTVIIEVTDDIQMINGANITSDTQNNGNAGNIYISARNLTLSAEEDSEDTGISSSATSKDIPDDAAGGPDGEQPEDFVSSGNAANIQITLSGDMVLIGEAEIKTEGESQGNAGNITIEAASFYMEGGELESKAEGEGFRAGDAGDVTLVIAGKVTIIDEAAIHSDSFNGGEAGNVSITAGSLEMGELGSITSTAALTQADAGNITITVDGDMVMSDGASIVSDSILANQAGIINISAQNLTLSGEGFPTRISSTSLLGLGTAGEINIDVQDTVTLTAGGQITSSTLGATGDAGTVNIDARNLLIDAQNQVSLEEYIAYVEDEFDDLPEEFEQLPLDDDDLIEWAAVIDIRSNELLSTGITTVSDFDAIGNAGVININVENLTVSNGGEINSSSHATGDAGDIIINADTLLMSHNDADIPTANISSQVFSSGLGAAGSITINAMQALTMNGGQVAVDTGATLESDEVREAGSINITTQQFEMTNGATITSGSSGNVAAGAIDITAQYRTALKDAQITSSAVDADAGEINLLTQQFFIEDSLVTTSVSNNGNGGNIAISSDFILMDGGFIQGNTGGENFAGGNISIDSDFLIVSNQSLQTGGEERLIFSPNSGINVIQAAAPDGVSGVVNIGALEFDLSDELASISAEVLSLDNLQDNPCNSGNTSTLANSGKGGLAQQPDEFNAPILNEQALKLRLTPDSANVSSHPTAKQTAQLTEIDIQCQAKASDSIKEYGAP